MILESKNLCLLAFTEGIVPKGDWCSDGDIKWWGWLELFFDVVDVLLDRSKVRCKEVGHEMFAVVVDAIKLEY